MAGGIADIPVGLNGVTYLSLSWPLATIKGWFSERAMLAKELSSCVVEKQVEFAAVSLLGVPMQVFSRALVKISSVREEFAESSELFRTFRSALAYFLGQNGCIAS